MGTASENVAFTPASGIPLVQHECTLYGAVYVSAAPEGDPEYLVPGCGCKPAATASEPSEGITEDKEANE